MRAMAVVILALVVAGCSSSPSPSAPDSPAALPPGATDFIGSAVVEFLGIPERAYLNLFAAEDGSILHLMTVLTPPVSPSASS